MTSGLSLISECTSTWTPPPNLLVSEWAERYRRLAPESSPVPGKWHNDITPYLVDVMDWLNDPNYHTCVFIKPSRAGATEAGINMKGYRAHLDPCHILYAQTSEGEVEKYVKKIFDPAVAASPILRDIIADAKKRNDDASSLYLKRFPGGTINLIGGSSPKGFRMVACPFVIGDDIDGMPDEAGDEGDPIELLISRAKNFWDRKIYLASTTTIKGQSRIDDWFQKSDMRYFYVPCQNRRCKLKKVTYTTGGFRFEWANMHWKKKGGKGIPSTAHYVCPECGYKHYDEKHKRAMIIGGKWRKTSESNGIAGFHLNRMYSPFIPWSEMVEDWINAQTSPKLLKVFMNHQLAEPWEEDDVIELDYEILYNKRREEYPRDNAGSMICPSGVYCITVGIDVQHNRFELEYVGWGLNDESWGLGYIQIPCDTSVQSNYEKHLDPVVSRSFKSESGINLRVVATAVDSGDGARTTEVYRYCHSRFDSGVYAIKGRGGPGIPVACQPTKQKFSDLTVIGKEVTVNLFNVGTDAAKSSIFSALKRTEVGGGYQHFPNSYTLEYFKMLTAEKSVLRKVKGKKKRVFEQIRDRNEALDCRVYAKAALEISGADLEQCKQLIERAVIQSSSDIKEEQSQRNGRVISKGFKP